MLTIAKHAPQYLELSRLLFKHGGSDLATAMGLGHADTDDLRRANRKGAAEKPSDEPGAFVRDIEKLGPAYIKLAQIASTREDLISREYIEALERLQDSVEPVDFQTICKIFEEDLGTSPSLIFRRLDERPCACGSLGQVHRATLRDGRKVVLKVQRPGVETEARKQLAALHDIAKVADHRSELGRRFRFCSLVQAVEHAMNIELDFRTEAANLQSLSENLKEFETIRIPRPIHGLYSKRVLVMEEMTGCPLRDVSGVVLNEVDTEAIANQIVRAYLKQILVDGLFHADPHPGNLFLTDDHRLGLIDGGMVVSVSSRLRKKLASLLMAISDREGEEAARLAMDIGLAEEDFVADAFVPAAARVIAQPDESPTKALSPGKMSIQLLNVAGQHGLVLPYEVILFSKSLLQMENTVYRLAPQLDLRRIVRHYATRLLLERASDTTRLTEIAKTALESAELASKLPQRLNRISEMIAENGLRVSVDAIDEAEFFAGLQKVANRITAGLVTSALIVAASLLIQANAGPHMYGVPILSVMFFILAALVGFYLVWLALFRDT